MAQTKAKIAARLFSRYIPFLDKLNHNALVGAWIKETQKTVNVFTCRRDLHAHINENVCANDPIDYLEFGVYRGETLRMWTEINRHADSRFIGFDSFAGLPED